MLVNGDENMPSNRALTALCIIAIAFSVINIYLLSINTRIQQEQLRELQNALGEAEGRIRAVELALSNFTKLIDFINQSSLETVASQLSDLKRVFESLLNQTPGNVYESVHRSVVVIRTPIGQGSGFFYTDPTLILTNWHVVESETDIEVEFYNGERLKASVVGTDAYADVAVIKVPSAPSDARPLNLADSSRLYIGQQVVAIGNPLGLTGSLSSGYISQTNKMIDLQPIIVPVLQLDISIAPGSSGGPLLDLSGGVIGITNAGTAYGFNFAVPSNIVKRVALSIIEKGYYRHPFVGFRGIELNPDTIKELNILNLDPFQTGLLIWEVLPDTPAAKAGLEGVIETQDFQGKKAYTPGDIILAVDGHLTRTFADWSSFIEEEVSPGQTITLTLWRSGQNVSVEITTTAREAYGG